MAAKKFERDGPEWRMFAEFWAICKLYWNPGPDMQLYWDQVHADTYMFAYEYRQVMMAKELAEAIRCASANKILTGHREPEDFSPESENQKAFAEFWIMVQNYWVPEDNDLYWELIVDALTQLCCKYERIVSIIHYLATSFLVLQEKRLVAMSIGK